MMSLGYQNCSIIFFRSQEESVDFTQVLGVIRGILLDQDIPWVSLRSGRLMGIYWIKTFRDVLRGQDDLLASLGLGHSVVSLISECFVTVS